MKLSCTRKHSRYRDVPGGACKMTLSAEKKDGLEMHEVASRA